MSGKYSNENMIIEDYPKADIHIVGSKTNYVQMGFAAIKEGQIASEGKSIEGETFVFKKVRTIKKLGQKV